MAKETSIIFVYDTQLVQKEEDDPASAILYFHPTWVSDQQKAALCGQIIGTIRCVQNILAKPKIVSLQSGKFFIIEDGRYLLAVGTDRNITDLLLEYRAKTLYSLVNFFHKDFKYLANLYTNESLSAKLYHMFETYLKMLMFGGNVFSHIPTLSLPKSASNVFMEAIHVLECCQELNNVLGGSMMYHNKVVASQLSSDLTKRLILTDPYRIKCPAETVEVTYELPLGVQLLQVYITNKEYCKLLECSLRNQNVFQYLTNKNIKKNYSKSNQQPQESQFLSAMKRDQSLLFTAVPEEGTENSPIPSDRPFIPASKKSRPKFLNLKSISIEENTDLKPVKAGTPFCGQRSVCSTPMTELKKFVHQNVLSICRNDDISDATQMAETVKSPLKTANSDELLKKSVLYFNVSSNLNAKKRFASLNDFNVIGNSISKDVDQYFSLKNKGLVELDLDSSRIKNNNVVRSKTICDPSFPVLNTNGMCISKFYYEKYIKTNLEMVQNELENKEKQLNKDPFHNFDCSTFVPKNKETSKMNNFKFAELPVIPVKNTKEHRKSLTLPLKSLSIDSEVPLSESTINRRYSSGVQLTPLMSKLSMLAFEERSSGFCSRDTTPCDYRGLTPTHPNFSFSFNKFNTAKEVRMNKIEDDSLQRCILFVCGQQDVVLTMLLKEEACEEVNTIKKLWEICTEHLTKLEKQLVYCMESQSGANSQESEPYSYLCLDTEWDTTQRGGPWGTNDMGMLNYLHRDFNNVPNLTDILIRGGDSIIYAHHCGPSEVFYHETANPTAGLPPPADPMGLVQLKAKRRLERDHAVILL